MNKQKLQQLVDHAVALHRELTVKAERLKALKTALVFEAKLHPDLLKITPSGGKRWTAQGSDGSVARVSFPVPTLLSEIDGQGQLADQCRSLAGDRFRRLFTPIKSYQLVDDFRADAVALLPAAEAEALTKLCEAQAPPRVSFETAKAPTATSASAA